MIFLYKYYNTPQAHIILNFILSKEMAKKKYINLLSHKQDSYIHNKMVKIEKYLESQLNFKQGKL